MGPLITETQPAPPSLLVLPHESLLVQTTLPCDNAPCDGMTYTLWFHPQVPKKT